MSFLAYERSFEADLLPQLVFQIILLKNGDIWVERWTKIFVLGCSMLLRCKICKYPEEIQRIIAFRIHATDMQMDGLTESLIEMLGCVYKSYFYRADWSCWMVAGLVDFPSFCWDPNLTGSYFCSCCCCFYCASRSFCFATLFSR